jgi:Holliday junction resolvase
MTHPSKRKGNAYERELVQAAKDAGLAGERAYASNGRALGHAEDVDCVIGGKRVQAKRRKALPAYLRPTETVDAVAFREDRGGTLVMITLTEWLDLLNKTKGTT